MAQQTGQLASGQFRKFGQHCLGQLPATSPDACTDAPDWLGHHVKLRLVLGRPKTKGTAPSSGHLQPVDRVANKAPNWSRPVCAPPPPETVYGGRASVIEPWRKRAPTGRHTMRLRWRCKTARRLILGHSLSSALLPAAAPKTREKRQDRRRAARHKLEACARARARLA